MEDEAGPARPLFHRHEMVAVVDATGEGLREKPKDEKNSVLILIQPSNITTTLQTVWIYLRAWCTPFFLNGASRTLLNEEHHSMHLLTKVKIVI